MLKTFAKGGIHPPENKYSANQPIVSIVPPDTVTIPVTQHIGAPSKVIVNKGDAVKAGQVIAQSEGFISTNIHASVSGKVVKVDSIVDSSGYKRPAVFIKVEGDEWLEGIDTSDALNENISVSDEEIIPKILEAGIVGMGGATFPSHVKLSVPRGKNAEFLVINGVECEPYLTADHQLMMEKGKELITGIQILMRGLRVKNAYVGIENNKKDAIKHLTVLAANHQGIEIVPLQVKYPQGGEKQLIKAILNREVPSGGLPIDVGAVVFNVGTTFAVYEAIQKNKPLIERVLTVTGKSVTKKGNYKVRTGTPMKHVIDAAGGLPEDTGKVISGGPMMGKALNSLEVPVIKGTSGILIIPDEEAHRKPVQPCIRCTKCVQVCPMGLEPYLLQVLSEKSMLERAENEYIMDCIECGSCSYTCPSNRPLLDYIRLGKQQVGKLIRSRKQ
ncbi:MAG: electron transport complex subunit RsxC [Bacteroidetes bacterium]|jgi:electron transport complex protein RnfC|nr:electron transport complex subunit RsxC [Bacteroidota bacterium]